MRMLAVHWKPFDSDVVQVWTVERDCRLIAVTGNTQFVVSFDPQMTATIIQQPAATEISDAMELSSQDYLPLNFPLSRGSRVFVSGSAGYVHLFIEDTAEP